MIGNDYEITARLVIETDKAFQSVNKALKNIENMKKGMSSAADGTGALRDNFEYLSSGINDYNKTNREALKNLKSLHDSLVLNDASIGQYHKKMREFAVDNGFVYRNGVMTDSLKDMQIEMKALTNTTPNVANAMEEISKSHEKLRESLTNGDMSVAAFNKKIRELQTSIGDKYGVTIRNAGNATFTFRESLTDVGEACKNFNKVLGDVNRKLERGTFKSSDLAMYRKARNELGLLVMGEKEYAEQSGKTGVGIRKLNTYINENSQVIGINRSEMDKFNRLSERNLAIRNRIGGSMVSLANGTATYNRMLTTITRSQRMQNYAMQVAAMRYNVVGQAVGFAAGMLGTQLVMGFADARIESIKFEQQAKQMLKTSRLNETQINKLTVAIEEYTKSHKKLNTAGLKYTIAQVTKLNNLTEEQAEKSIPVIADITNMMQINGRTQEDAILAVNDALDGQFKRLQEIGVSGKQMLKAYGWTGMIDTPEGINSLLEALQKIGEQKGWSDLTEDVSTLDDAYKVLGNTIDDFLTPAVTAVTPHIVDATKGISALLGGLGNAPLIIQGAAGAVTILGGAFVKMKVEMLKAKIVGSEWMARLTGLDDGMYGITQSIGAVNLAVKDSEISFEQGTRVLMNHHQEQVRAVMTYDDATRKLDDLNTAMMDYEARMKGMTKEEAAKTEKILKGMKAEYDEIYAIRDLDQAYTRYKLALSGANSETKLRLGNIKRLLGANEAEMTHIVTTKGLLNEATGEIEIFDKYTGELNDGLKELGLTTEQVNSYWSGIKSGKRNGLTNALIGSSEASKELEKNLLGLNRTTELVEKTTYNEGLVQQTTAKLRALGTDAAEAEAIAIGAVNATAEKEIFTKELLATAEGEAEFAIAAETLALEANSTAQTINTFATKNGTTGLTKYLTNVKQTAVALKNMAERLATNVIEMAAADPVGFAVGVGAIAAAVVVLNSKLQGFLKLQKSADRYNDILRNGQDNIDKLDAKLAKMKKNTKEYDDLLAYRNYLEKEYKKITGVESYSQYGFEKSMGGIIAANEDMKNYFKKQGYNYDYTAVGTQAREIKNLTDEQERFEARAPERNRIFSESLKNSGKSIKEQAEFMQSYADHQVDVDMALEKMKSPEMWDKLGGRWDNFWAHAAMGWDEWWAQFYTSFSEPPVDNSTFEQRMNEWFIGDFDMGNWWKKNITDPLNYWMNPNNWTYGIIGFDLTNWIFNKLGININTTNNAIDKWWNKNITNPLNYWMNPNNWTNNIAGFNLANWIFNKLGIDMNATNNAIGNWWNKNVADPLSSALSKLGIDLHVGGKKAGSNVKSGLNEGSKGSEKGVDSNLKSVNSTIKNNGKSYGDSAKDAGGEIKSGIKDGSKGAKQSVDDEMSGIKGILKRYAAGQGSFYTWAYNAAKSIINGIKNGLNQHSPGDAAKAVLKEMEYTQMFMEQEKPILEDTANSIGQSIVDGISNNQFKPNINMTDMLNQSKDITSNNKAIIDSNIKMGIKTESEYTNMQETVDSAFKDMSNSAKNNLLSIAEEAQNDMTDVNSVIKDGLKPMDESTLSVTRNMISAWTVMKNSIIKSADEIRSQSYAKFNSLHKSISSFYNQIQNARFNFGSLAAGSPKLSRSRSVRHTTPKSGSSYKGFSSNIKRFGTAGLSNDDEYLKILKNVLNGRAKRSDIEALYRKGYFDKDGYYFGGINVNAHVNRQLNSAYSWRMKSPSMYGINLGMDMTVGDFKDGNSSPFTYSNFEHYLRMILTARGFNNPASYDFYWNSQRSNQQVWDSVSCNCCDGAELIVEIAKDMGLKDAKTIHGRWGSLGHVGAKIGGKVYDMTQFQHSGIFRGHPAVSWSGNYNGNPRLLASGSKGKPIKWSSARKRAGVGSSTTNNKRVININLTGNTFIGEEDYKNRIKQISREAAEDLFYEMHSPNNAIGY